MRIESYTELQNRKKEVSLTSGILFANRHVRVNSLHRATGDSGPFHMSQVTGLLGYGTNFAVCS